MSERFSNMYQTNVQHLSSNEKICPESDSSIVVGTPRPEACQPPLSGSNEGYREKWCRLFSSTEEKCPPPPPYPFSKILPELPNPITKKRKHHIIGVLVVISLIIAVIVWKACEKYTQSRDAPKGFQLVSPASNLQFQQLSPDGEITGTSRSEGIDGSGSGSSGSSGPGSSGSGGSGSGGSGSGGSESGSSGSSGPGSSGSGSSGSGGSGSGSSGSGGSGSGGSGNPGPGGSGSEGSGSTGTGSPTFGSTGTGSPASGSAGTGSPASGSAGTGSSASGSTGTGSSTSETTGTGSSATKTTETGNSTSETTGTGSSATKTTETGHSAENSASKATETGHLKPVDPKGSGSKSARNHFNHTDQSTGSPVNQSDDTATGTVSDNSFHATRPSRIQPMTPLWMTPCSYRIANWDTHLILPGLHGPSSWSRCQVLGPYRIPDDISLDSVKLNGIPEPILSMRTYDSPSALVHDTGPYHADTLQSQGAPAFTATLTAIVLEYVQNGQLRRFGGKITDLWTLNESFQFSPEQSNTFMSCISLRLEHSIGMPISLEVENLANWITDPTMPEADRAALSQFLKKKCFQFHDLRVPSEKVFAPSIATTHRTQIGGDGTMIDNMKRWVSSLNISNMVELSVERVERDEQQCSSHGIKFKERCFCDFGFIGDDCSTSTSQIALERPRAISAATGLAPTAAERRIYWEFLPHNHILPNDLTYTVVFNPSKEGWLLVSITPDGDFASFTFLKKGISLQSPQNTRSHDEGTFVRYTEPNGLRVNNYTCYDKRVTAFTTSSKILPDNIPKEIMLAAFAHARTVKVRDPEAAELRTLPTHLITIFQDDTWFLY